MLKITLNDTIDGDIYSFINDGKMLPIKCYKEAYLLFREESLKELQNIIQEKTGIVISEKDIEESIKNADDLRIKQYA
jgi:hypothetical protein